MSEMHFECRPASDREREFTAQQLREHTEAAIGIPVKHVPFGLLAYEEEQLVGSIVGKVFFEWLHIDLTWVMEARRHRGIGRELMKEAALKAREMGLLGIEVWTQSWQAPAFYRKMGYEEFAVLDDFIPGAKRHAFRLFLSKPAHA